MKMLLTWSSEQNSKYGAQTGCSSGHHENAVKFLPPYSVQENDTQTVGRKLDDRQQKEI